MDEIKFSEKAKNIKLGIYEHYKKKRYQVLGVVIDSDSLEEFVLYKALYGNGITWVKPFDLFFMEIEVDGVRQPRFAFIEELK